MKPIRPWLAVASLILLLSAGQTFADEPGAAAAKPARLRVLTYNIQHGAGMTDKEIDLARTAKVITDSKADLVALQEVDSKTKRSNGVDQTAELAKLTNMHAVFGKAMDYGGGGYGEAILSRFPIVETKTHALPFTQGREPRAALEVSVRPPSLPAITFVGTHLDHLNDETDRLAQTREINRVLVRKDAPATILVGDLNAQPDSQAMTSMLEMWNDTAGSERPPTFPADKPRIKIDWVLTLKTQGWRVISSEVLDEKAASDHRPLLVELEWVSANNKDGK
jgi:endonuclease/exonuclease/phosphatase family metal-dependent hydrolase